MTGGGPGFTCDVLASVIYKQYQAGFFGLSTAGNVVLFLLVTVDHGPAVVVPQPKAGGTCEARERRRAWIVGAIAILVSIVVFLVPFAFILAAGGQDPSASPPLLAVLLAEALRAVRRTSGRAQRATTTVIIAFINSAVLTVGSASPLMVADRAHGRPMSGSVATEQVEPAASTSSCSPG